MVGKVLQDMRYEDQSAKSAWHLHHEEILRDAAGVAYIGTQPPYHVRCHMLPDLSITSAAVDTVGPATAESELGWAEALIICSKRHRFTRSTWQWRCILLFRRRLK